MFEMQNKEKKMNEISKQLSLIDLEINKILPKNKMPVFLKKEMPVHIEAKVETAATAKGSVKILEIKKLSDQNLLFQTKYLVQKERNITIQVLRHLSEIESRKLHLKRGFASLFDYAVRDLGYSHSAAYRRIKVMKLCREVPEIVSKLKVGSLNLTTVSKVQSYFEKQDKKAKKSQTEFNLTNQEMDTIFVGDDENCKSNNIIVECNPEKNLPATIKKNFLPAEDCIITETKKQTKSDKSGLNLNQKLDLLEQVIGKSSRQTEKLLCEMDSEIYQIKDKVRYLNKDQIEIKLTVNKNSYENLEILKSLLSHKSPNMSYGRLFQTLSELGLDKYDPRRKLKKQKEKNLPTKIKNNFSPAAGRVRNNKEVSSEKIASRYIPTKIKRLVWTRDQGQCTYICPETKKKCGSKHFLQIDHIHPYSLGGSSKLNNLRLLCAGHNQYRNKLFQ